MRIREARTPGPKEGVDKFDNLGTVKQIFGTCFDGARVIPPLGKPTAQWISGFHLQISARAAPSCTCGSILE